jgi:hypothetical protein
VFDKNEDGLMRVNGVYRVIPNPNRKWWQFWKPKKIVTDELQTFRILNGYWDATGRWHFDKPPET